MYEKGLSIEESIKAGKIFGLKLILNFHLQRGSLNQRNTFIELLFWPRASSDAIIGQEANP